MLYQNKSVIINACHAFIYIIQSNKDPSKTSVILKVYINIKILEDITYDIHIKLWNLLTFILIALRTHVDREGTIEYIFPF